MFKKLFSLFTSSKRRKNTGTKRKKRSIKKRTRRVFQNGMRGGWGEPMTVLPETFKKSTIMKGGWGGPVNTI